MLEVLPTLGDFVPAGAPWCASRDSRGSTCTPCAGSRSIRSGRSIRTAYGPRLLVDLRALARGAVRPDNRRASHRPSPRLPAPTRESEVSERRVPRPSRYGAAGDQDLVGRLRAPVVRGDPQGCGRIGSGDAAAARLLRGSAAVRLEEPPPLERQLACSTQIDSNGPASLDLDVWRQSDPQGIGASRALPPYCRCPNVDRPSSRRPRPEEVEGDLHGGGGRDGRLRSHRGR